MTEASASTTPKQVVAAVIVRGGRVLICQRTIHQELPLKWEFPGGKIEAGETAEAALKRELQEELCIEAEVGRRLASVRHRYHHDSELELHFFFVERYSGDPINMIFKEIRWEELAKLPQYDFLEADQRFVRDLSAGKIL